MRPNKTNIKRILSDAGIAATYLNDDPHWMDPCFNLHGIYEGIQISFGRGAALICKQVSDSCIVDRITTDALDILEAVKNVAAEK